MTEEKLTEKDYEVLDACCELLSIKIDELKAENEKLNKILQEIKEIAERQLLVTNVRTYQMVYYADFSEYRNEILQIITKAEEE